MPKITYITNFLTKGQKKYTPSDVYFDNLY